MKQIHALFVALSIITFTFIFTACVPEAPTPTPTPSDSTAPVITEVTPVTTPSTDYTPEYTFNTDEAGTISYGGGCSSDTTSATVGDNTISFSPLIDGDYASCTIIVTDAAGNASNELAVTGFEVTVGLIKLDITGVALADQSQAWNPTGGDESTFDRWSCVYDNRTGYTWEVKQESGYRAYTGQGYSWYDSSLPAAQQGSSFGIQCDLSPDCNTELYITTINALNLCGYSDWRLPTVKEAMTLSGASTVPDFFRDLGNVYFWTTETNIDFDELAWRVNPGSDYSNLDVKSHPKSSSAFIRLIRP